MKRKEPFRRDLLSSCNEIGAEDGADPRIFFRPHQEKKLNRKALQLCGEVAKSVGHVLAWELGDEVLGELHVEAVVPAPDSTRLLVTVSLLGTPGGSGPADLQQRLRGATGRLRREIASAIHRRRVPDLVFRVELRKEVGP